MGSSPSRQSPITEEKHPPGHRSGPRMPRSLSRSITSRRMPCTWSAGITDTVPIWNSFAPFFEPSHPESVRLIPRVPVTVRTVLSVVSGEVKLQTSSCQPGVSLDVLSVRTPSKSHFAAWSCAADSNTSLKSTDVAHLTMITALYCRPACSAMELPARGGSLVPDPTVICRTPQGVLIAVQRIARVCSRPLTPGLDRLAVEPVACQREGHAPSCAENARFATISAASPENIMRRVTSRLAPKRDVFTMANR
eukprot:166709-Prymnesium_polylepis.2